MKVLAIETSSPVATVAVAEHDRLIEMRRFEAPRGRGAELFTVLESLRDLWHDADRMAVGIGPGSYNGLRTACAIAGAFELSLGIELVAVPSPCLLDVAEARFFAAGDARGGRIYFAAVEDRKLCGEISLLDAGQFAERCQATGDAPVYRVGKLPGWESLPETFPDARVLALLAPGLPATDPAALEPLYLKPPHITTPRQPACDLPLPRKGC